MNSILVSINAILALSALSPVIYGAAANYPQSKLEGMVGYAAEGKTTGGSGGQVVTINTLADLQKYVGDNQPQVLVINSDISTPILTKVNLGSNKSIIGSFGKRTLNNIHFRAIAETENIIFQNLIFQHSADIKANDDIQLYLNFGQRYWIDHCSFVGHVWSENDGSLDKLLYIGDKADLATISNCYFGNHKYGVILGHAQDGDMGFDGFPKLTIANNHYENLDVRAPGLMRYGHYHVYSNYINVYHLGFTITTNAQVLSENNFFEGGSGKELDDYGTAAFSDAGSAPQILQQKSPECAMKITYPYKSIPAKDAKAFVIANAGAQSKELVFGS